MLPLPYEILIVDDGSTDDSAARMRSLHAADPRIGYIVLSRNFGHQNALLAGLDAASGDAVIMMDADLQHPASLLPRMIEKWQQGFQIVSMVRTDTVGQSWFKRATSALFYRVLNACGDVRVQPGAADFRLLDRSVVEVLRRFPERFLFFRGLMSLVGFRQVAIPYVADRRYAGSTAYSLRHMCRFALGNLLRFSVMPLHIILVMGVFTAFFAFIYGMYGFVEWGRGNVQSGWTSLFFVVLSLGSMQLLGIGIMGQYIANIYTEVRRRPRYIVSESAGIAVMKI